MPGMVSTDWNEVMMPSVKKRLNSKAMLATMPGMKL